VTGKAETSFSATDGPDDAAISVGVDAGAGIIGAGVARTSGLGGDGTTGTGSAVGEGVGGRGGVGAGDVDDWL
jgi:hypothetical protein